MVQFCRFRTKLPQSWFGNTGQAAVAHTFDFNEALAQRQAVAPFDQDSLGEDSPVGLVVLTFCLLLLVYCGTKPTFATVTQPRLLIRRPVVISSIQAAQL